MPVPGRHDVHVEAALTVAGISKADTRNSALNSLPVVSISGQSFFQAFESGIFAAIRVEPDRHGIQVIFTARGGRLNCGVVGV
jgi:hypothetical protein